MHGDLRINTQPVWNSFVIQCYLTNTEICRGKLLIASTFLLENVSDVYGWLSAVGDRKDSKEMKKCGN